MTNSKIALVGWQLIGSCAPALIFFALNFGNNRASSLIVFLFSAGVIYFLIAFPLGVSCLVADQFLRWFDKSSRD